MAGQEVKNAMSVEEEKTAAVPVAPTAPAVPAETLAKLTAWSQALGKPFAELTKMYEEQLAIFKQGVAGKTAEWYDSTARHRVYLKIKSSLRSPAKPYDYITLGLSGAIDVTRSEREEKADLYANEETRAQAVAEKKVLGEDTQFGDKVYPAGTPLDTRQWMVKPDPEKNVKGRKSPSYGKPLLPRYIRTLLSFGRPAGGGNFKLLATMCNAGDPNELPMPPLGKGFRTRLNLSSDTPNIYHMNWSTQARFEPIVLPEYEPITTERIIKIFQTAPEALKSSLDELMAWHNANKNDKRRLVIVEADVTWINRTPTDYGSYMMVLEDVSKEDLGAEGTPCWVPTELKHVIDTFGPDSRVYVVGRTNIGPGYDREKREVLPDVQRVNLNAVAIWAIPIFRTAPEEQTVVMPEATPVQ